MLQHCRSSDSWCTRCSSSKELVQKPEHTKWYTVISFQIDVYHGAATLLKFYQTQNKTQHWKEQTKLNKLWNNDSQNQRTKNCSAIILKIVIFIRFFMVGRQGFWYVLFYARHKIKIISCCCCCFMLESKERHITLCHLMNFRIKPHFTLVLDIS